MTQFSASFDSKKPHTHTLSVVGHVSGGGAELGVGLDDLVNGLQEVFLGGDLPASPDGEHARLCAHAADLSAWQETHKSNSAYRTNRKHCTTSVIHVPTIPTKRVQFRHL